MNKQEKPLDELWNWNGFVYIGDYNGQKLSALLYELADQIYETKGGQPHDEPYPGAGYCVCHICQVLAPMAMKLEAAYEAERSALCGIK